MAGHGFDTLNQPMSAPIIPTFLLGDVVRLTRPHPCGGDTWQIDRLGADLGLRCLGCGRHVLLARATVERRLADFVTHGDATLTAAADPFSTGSDR